MWISTYPNNDCIQDCYGIWGGTAINCETLLEVSSEFYVLPQGNELNIIETIVNASLLIPTTVTSSGNIINNIMIYSISKFNTKSKW